MKNFDHNNSETDPEKYVQENREEILSIIRTSGDPFMRACAWALLDKHTPDAELEELYEELDAVDKWGENS